MLQSTKTDAKVESVETPESAVVASDDQSTEPTQEKSPIDKLRERLKKMNKA